MKTMEQKIEKLRDLCDTNEELDECVEAYLTRIVNIMLESLKKSSGDVIDYYYEKQEELGDDTINDETYKRLNNVAKKTSRCD